MNYYILNRVHGISMEDILLVAVDTIVILASIMEMLYVLLLWISERHLIL